MSKGLRRTPSGKLLGELGQEDLQKSVAEAGWVVDSASSLRSGAGTTIVTVTARRDPGLEAKVSWIEDPDYGGTAARKEQASSDKSRVSYLDGDYVLEVLVKKDGVYAEDLSHELLRAIVGAENAAGSKP